jgi:hypothetical protein
MLAWMSRVPKAKTLPQSPSRSVPKRGGQSQIVRTIRKTVFPREFCTGVGVLTKGMGVLELDGVQRVREFNRSANFPRGTTVRGVGHAKTSSFAL